MSYYTSREKPGQSIDVNELAEAVAQAIAKMGLMGIAAKSKDDFNDVDTLKKMADLMTRPADKDSNMEQAGRIETHKKDVSDTLELLKDINE